MVWPLGRASVALSDDDTEDKLKVELPTAFGGTGPEKSQLRDLNPARAMRGLKPSEAAARVATSIFPILEWLPKYDYKETLKSDLVAGVTVGAMLIPQGMSYALIAGLPPVFG